MKKDKKTKKMVNILVNLNKKCFYEVITKISHEVKNKSKNQVGIKGKTTIIYMQEMGYK